MAKNNWTIVPQYDQKGNFIGYGIKDENKKFITENGKPFIINDQNKKYWADDTMEECPNGCTITYKGRKWKVTESQLQEHYKPKTVYKATRDQDGNFTGYDMEQGGKKVGHLGKEHIFYKETNKGMQAFWKDSSGKEHFIETLSEKESQKRMGDLQYTNEFEGVYVDETNNNIVDGRVHWYPKNNGTLSAHATNTTNPQQSIPTNANQKGYSK